MTPDAINQCPESEKLIIFISIFALVATNNDNILFDKRHNQ